MPDIDVSETLVSVQLSDIFTVQRRTQATDNTGRVQFKTVGTFTAYGVVYPVAPSSLERDRDYQMMRKAVQVVTAFRLQGPSDGYAPDLVIWPQTDGDQFIVSGIEDYSAFGGGFVSALCLSIDPMDQPPAP